MTTEADDDKLVTLTDDDDNEVEFRILAIVEVDDADFALLTPANPGEDEDQMEIYIFSYEVDEEADTVTYGAVEDGDLFERVVARAEEIISFEDDDDEEYDFDDEE